MVSGQLERKEHAWRTMYQQGPAQSNGALMAHVGTRAGVPTSGWALCTHSRKAETGTLAEGRCDPTHHSTLIHGYWWLCCPWSLLDGLKSLLPLCLGSIQVPPETLRTQTKCASPVNRISKSFLLPSPDKLLHLPPIPCVSHCLLSSQLSNES